MKIQITQKHINKGISGCSDNCAVTLALRDAGLIDPTVGLGNNDRYTVFHGIYMSIKQIKITDKMNDFITQFDEENPDNPCQPCELEIEI